MRSVPPEHVIFAANGICEAKIKTSKKLDKVFYSLEDSDCPYVFDYDRIKVFNKNKNPCTNQIVTYSGKGCKSMDL